ncbi:MAG: isocitrate lyase/phosphoenolpyruvate mutase family protein [Pseudomonadota bacterium]
MSGDRGAAFRALHRPGTPFVLANAWDRGSAQVLATLGAEAIGTTSAGFAFTRGKPDMGHVTRDEMLAHCADLAGAVALPVSGDLENGYGDAPEAVAETVRLAFEAGLAGCSIEDVRPPAGGAYGADEALERVRAGIAAARALPRDFVFVARADGVMTGAYDLETALARIRAFAAAGADCVYVPLPPDMDGLRRVVAAVDVPVNALAAGRFLGETHADFAAAGVARISVGSALARATHRTLVDAASAMLGRGDFSQLGGIGGDRVDRLLKGEKA